jgi:Fe-S oxidoreductase
MRRHLVIEGRMDGRARMRWQPGRCSSSRPVHGPAQSGPRASDPDQGRPAEPVEYLWFVGDYGSYNSGLTEITRLTAEVFGAAGLDFGILFEAERNAGNDARRVGEEGLFEMLREKNLASLEKCSFRTIVTTDPHSYNTLKNEYAWGEKDGREILHVTELIDRLLASGRLRAAKELGYKVTYHDPCYLGRYNGVYDPPRRILARSAAVLEMPRNRDGPVLRRRIDIWMDEGQMRERPSEARIREAVSLDGAQIFAVACPKDVTMYRDALKTTALEGKLVVKDVIELVREAM